MPTHDSQVVAPPDVGDTGSVASTLERGIQAPTGRSSSNILIVAFAIVGVVLLAAGAFLFANRGNKPTPAPSVSATSPTSTTSVVNEREAAFVASEKTLRALNVWSAAHPTQPAPAGLESATLAAAAKAGVEANAQQGLRSVGQDTLVSMTRGSYVLVPQFTTTWKLCYATHAKLLDKAGNNVRVSPSGKLITDGQHLAYTYTVISPDNGTTWLVDKIDGAGTC